MDKETIIRWAREQGLPETATEGVFIVNTDDLGRMLAAEREACAKVCDAEWSTWEEKKHGNALADSIRARKTT